MKKPKQLRPPKLTDSERHNRFVEMAKKVEASDNSEDFDKAFSRLDLTNSSAGRNTNSPLLEKSRKFNKE